MKQATLLQAAGAAAIMGGTLRIASLFAFTLARPTLAYLHFLTDVFLVFGMTGWYLSRAGRLGIFGLAGFATSVVGILMIRSGALFGVDNYLLGAGVLLLGLAAMNVATFFRRDGTISAPALWLASLISAVAYLSLPARAGVMFAIVSPLLFGLGFVLAGAELLRTSEKP